MGKKKCWFSYVKRFFLPGSKPKSEEKLKKKIWFLEMFKFKKCAAIEAPETTLDEATEDHRKRAVAVAVATAAAAEAAVAAANAAAEVVRLTNVPFEIERRRVFSAVVKIQCVYRGHLARKALSALKGIVKIQAVVRGELVRKNVIKRLASISSSLKLKPQARKERVVTLLDFLSHSERRHSLSHVDGIQSEEAKLKSSSGRSWDLTTVSEGALETFYLRKQEARDKRERMKQYSYSHRERRNEQSLQEALSKESVKSSRFDRHFDLNVHQNEEKESLRHLSHSRTTAVGHLSQLTQLRTSSSCKHDICEEVNSPFTMPRRSFSHMKQRSIGNDRSLPNSPIFPAYMAATESAKAKSRSMSMPKQRLKSCDPYSAHNSPLQLNLSTWSSFNNCDMTNSGKRNSVSQQMG